MKELEGYENIGIQPWENIKDGDRFVCDICVYEVAEDMSYLFYAVLPSDKYYYVRGAAKYELVKHIPVWRKKEEEWVEFEVNGFKRRVHRRSFEFQVHCSTGWQQFAFSDVGMLAIQALISAGVLQTKEEGK